MADDLALAAALAHEAGQLAAGMLAAGPEMLKTRRKTSITDIVTAADHAAEALIADRLRSERPDDGLVGEEGTSKPGERTWFIDPVDGTYNFRHGIPFWCTAIALADDEGPILAAIYHPARDELWTGGRKYPLMCNGVEMPPIADHPLSHVCIASYLHPTRIANDWLREPMRRVISDAATQRMLGSSSVELAYVAHGRLGAWLQANSIEWDWYPGAALVRAAGGVATTHEFGGQRWHIAGSARTVDDILARLTGT